MALYSRTGTTHWCGLWEVVVKRFKHHLRRIDGNVQLTYEVLTTILAKIEAYLNSRPTVPLHNAEDGSEDLTPGYFVLLSR